MALNSSNLGAEPATRLNEGAYSNGEQTSPTAAERGEEHLTNSIWENESLRVVELLVEPDGYPRASIEWNDEGDDCAAIHPLNKIREKRPRQLCTLYEAHMSFKSSCDDRPSAEWPETTQCIENANCVDNIECIESVKRVKDIYKSKSGHKVCVVEDGEGDILLVFADQIKERFSMKLLEYDEQILYVPSNSLALIPAK